MKPLNRDILLCALAMAAAAAPRVAFSQSDSPGGPGGTDWGNKPADSAYWTVNGSMASPQPQTTGTPSMAMPHTNGQNASYEAGTHSSGGAATYEVAPQTGAIQGEQGARSGIASYEHGTAIGATAFETPVTTSNNHTVTVESAATNGSHTLTYTNPPSSTYSNGQWNSSSSR